MTRDKFNPRTNIKWNPILAIRIANGEIEGTSESELEAFSYIICNGMDSMLNETGLRLRNDAIALKYIYKTGAVNWVEVDKTESDVFEVIQDDDTISSTNIEPLPYCGREQLNDNLKSI